MSTNAAIMLKRHRPDIHLDYVTTLGGVHCRSMPNNVWRTSNIIGIRDNFAFGRNPTDPWSDIYDVLSDHFGYFNSARRSVINILRGIGLR